MSTTKIHHCKYKYCRYKKRLVAILETRGSKNMIILPFFLQTQKVRNSETHFTPFNLISVSCIWRFTNSGQATGNTLCIHNCTYVLLEHLDSMNQGVTRQIYTGMNYIWGLTV